jgi:hypothetical protein
MTTPPPSQIKDPIESFDYCEPELIIGMVCAVGADYNPIRDYLTAILTQFGYKTHCVRISSLIPKLTDFPLAESPEIERIKTHIEAGNRGCHASGRKDLWALAAIADINAAREKEEHGHDFFVQKPLPRTAHILLSLKRPEEVATLRKVYGDGFFLIGVFATEKERLEFLLNQNVVLPCPLIVRSHPRLWSGVGRHRLCYPS